MSSSHSHLLNRIKFKHRSKFFFKLREQIDKSEFSKKFLLTEEKK